MRIINYTVLIYFLIVFQIANANNREFNEWLISNNQLTSAFIETTYRCNEKCLHCFNPGAAHEIGEVPKRNTNELTFDQYKDVIDELYDLGIWSICLSGGEFFLRKDAFEILNYINFKEST